MLKIRSVNIIDVSDFDDLVIETYGRPYSFQQQDGCKERGTYEFSVPLECPYDIERDSIPEKVNGKVMGVSFAAWLARDPKRPLNSDNKDDREYGIDLFWSRNFYPSVDMIIQDLHTKGLLPDGDYVIKIDW